MADTDATKGTGTTPDGEGSEGSPDPAGLGNESEVALARRRQAGADAARAEAVARAERAEARAAELEAAEQARANKGKPEADVLREQLAAAEKRAAEAEQAANDRILDRLFPKARAEFPEVRDEARLAKLEKSLYAEQSDEEDEPPTPRGNNGPRRSGPNGSEPEKTSKQMFEDLKRQGLPWTPQEITG